MATKSSTDITLKMGNRSPLQMIQILLDSGWSYNENNEIWYLPLHDNGMFDWKKKPIFEWEQVKSEIEEKSRLKDIVGIDLIWDATLIGGQFHLNFAPDLLSINWNINRKSNPLDSDKTDLEWYEPRVITPLLRAGIEVCSVKSEDVDLGGTIINSTFHDAKDLNRFKNFNFHKG